MLRNKHRMMLKSLSKIGKIQQSLNVTKDVILKQDINMVLFQNQDSSLRVYSRGGSEFIVPMHFKIVNVFPIENGIIVKVFYDKDLLLFDPLQIRKDQNKQKPQEFSYLTISNHPLDDIYPLSFGGEIDMISTQIDILFVSYKIPFIVLYNPQTQKVIFGLLKKRVEDHQMQEVNEESGESYIKSIEPESRHHDIYNISKDYNIYIQEIYTFSTNVKPSKIFLSNGINSAYELVVTLYYQDIKKVEFLSLDIRQPKIVRKVNELMNIQDIAQITFSKQRYSQEDSISIISKTKATNLSQQDVRQQISSDLKMLKMRLKLFTKDTILCESNGRNIKIFQGSSPIFQFDFMQYIENTGLAMDKLGKGTIIEAFEKSGQSKINVVFNNGVSKRFSLKLHLHDFLIKSVMKTFKVILPQNIYENLNQDLIETLARCNIESQKMLNSISNLYQFTKFTYLLLALFTGDHSYFQTLQQQQQQQQQQQVAVQVQPNIHQQAKPTTTLQTKILRSSTTSFGTDSLANRRKTQNQPSSQQQQQNTFIQQQLQRQQQQIKTSSIIGASQIVQTQQRRLATQGILETQPLNGSNPPNSSVQTISQNPFADLLNSDFHKDNFKNGFAQLFPADLKFTIPSQPVQTEQQPLQISPTKTQGKTTTAQRVSSSRQSNILQSSHERKNSSISFPTKEQPPSIYISTGFKTQKQDIKVHFDSIFSVLHLLYEDLKLNKLRDTIESPKLAKLLLKLALAIDPYRKAAYIDYYLKEYPTLKEDIESEIKKAFKDGQIIKDDIEIQSVPKIFKWLENCLKKQQSNVLNYPFPLFFERTRKIVRVYEILNSSKQNSLIMPLLFSNNQYKIADYNTIENLILNQSYYQRIDFTDYRDYLKHDKQDLLSSLHLFEKVLFTLKEESMNVEELKKLPSIVSLPILEIIRYARLFQQEIQTLPQWPDSLYKLIQREDILNNLRLFQRSGKENKQSSIMEQQIQAMGSDLAITRQISKKFAFNRALTNVFQGTTAQEIQQEEHRQEMQNNIMKTAADLINAKGNLSGDDKQGNNKIMDFLKNRFSSDTRFKEVQSMLNSSAEIIIKLEHIANRESLAEEALNTEKQKLLDKMFLKHLSKSVGRGALTFGTVQTLPTETLHIPKINSTGYVPMNETYMQVEFKDESSKDILQWPEFHNGVAAALRIAQSFNKGKGDIHQSSHTRNWIMYHKPQEPKYEHGGFLLAIGLLGQFDTLQPTDIYQHLKSTHDATTIGILLGRAASKIGTMDDHDTRTLCIHIPYLLPPTLSIDISLSIQSAAVVGAGLLYKGTSNRLMTEMLLAQIGRKPLSDKAIEREGYALASGIALGLVNLGIGGKMQGLSDLKLDERLIRYVEGGKIMDLPSSMLSQNFNHDNTKCSSIKEGDMVNVHITSQGALIALALIYLKSNNKSIANQLLMPQTFYSLESVRPSFLLQKVLCKNLILWDEIMCSQQWITSQIPQIIRDIYENEISNVEKKFQQKLIEDGIDYSTAALCYVNIIAGAVFSIGFKYAGTGNREALKIILEYTQFFKKLKVMQSNKDSIGMIHNNFTKNQVDKNTVETCLCVSAFAMSMVMAGTGDIECFRALRVLRKRFEHEMHYGYNMAIHMSLGFLFLGSGAFTFSRNDLAIASLLCSLYPVFPQTPSDNRYHLQALRHFYVLAIESRLLQARDIDSGEFLNIQMQVEVEEQSNDDIVADFDKQIKIITIQTPDIINGKIKSIEVKNDKYHTVNLKFNNDEDAMNNKTHDYNNQLLDKKQKIFEQFDFKKIVYVKKKASSQIIEESHLLKHKTAQKKSNNINNTLIDSLEKLDQNQKDLLEEQNDLQERILQIKDPSIQSFYKNFTLMEELENNKYNLSEIEDVLLAQNREAFSQLSPIEFFKIQDLYDQIKEYMVNNHIPQTVAQKLNILRTLHDSYYQDKIEMIISLLDKDLNDKRQYRQEMKCQFINAYSQYRSNLKEFSNLQQNQTSSTRLTDVMQKCTTQSLLKLLTNYPQIDYTQEIGLLNVDLHELQISKIIVEQLLSKIRGQGESEIVKRYKFHKINGLKMEEGSSEFEVNEMIKMTIQQIIGDQDDLNPAFVNDIVVPAILQVEKN